MMKLSKKYLIVSLSCFSVIFAVALILYCSSKNINVVAAGDNQDNVTAIQEAIGSCGHSGVYAVDEDGNQILDSDNQPVDNGMYLLKDGYFKFTMKELNDGDSDYSKYCTGYDGWSCYMISVEKGSFKIGDVHLTKYSNEELYIDNFYYYYVANNSHTLSKNNPVIVRFNAKNDSITENVLLKFKFLLAKDIKNNSGNGCVAWDTNETLKAHENSDDFANLASGHPKTTADDYKSYGTDMEIDIAPASDQPTVHNPYYDTYCADLRTGSNDHFKSEIFEKYYNAAYYDEYVSYLGDVCKEEVVGIRDDAKVKEFLETIISTTWANNNANTASKYPVDEEFKDYKDKFDEYKQKAIDAGHSYDGDSVSTISKTNTEFNLKCKANPVSKTEFNSAFNSYISDPVTKLSTYNISANKEYYYAVKTDSTAINFTKTFTSGLTQDLPLGECKQTCEEVVVVEYGPPIASTGGICFEYQVQVTSRIQCTTTNTLQPMPNLPLCTPYPSCNSSRTFWSQAGPNEEFEECINTCDGGKYTEKCSESCYNKVYGITNKDKLQKNAFNYSDVIASKTYVGSALSFDGKYYWDGNVIRWDNPNTYGRYYSTGYQYNCLNGGSCAIGHHGYNAPGSGSAYSGYYWPINGFKWHFAYSNGGACSNVCSWHGCGKYTYLNEEERKADADKLAEVYSKASNVCGAKASCTEKTAKFKISVDYSYYPKDELEKAKENESYKPVPTNVNMEFPYSTKEDKLVSSSKENGCSGPTTNLEYNPNRTILNYAGCYKNCGDDTLYHTRWSFPGGWESTKSGEISWEDKSKYDDWSVVPDKFCVPSTLVDTNVKFWKYYINNLPSEQVPSWAEFVKKRNISVEYTDEDASKIDYNIHASTSDFGYFGWNFNFSCFFSSFGQGKEDALDIVFNTVDLKDLFPNSNGTTMAPDAYSIEDEKIPYNWSSRAVQNNGEKPFLQSNPIEYGKFVQKSGYEIYNDDELEYHFHLTPSTMKSFNKSGYKPTDQSGVVNNQGIQAYVSKLIRTGDLKDATVRAPSEGVLGCINIKNVKNGTDSGNCVSISDLAK